MPKRVIDPMKMPAGWAQEAKAIQREKAIDIVLVILCALMIVLGVILEAEGEAYTVQTSGGPLNIRAKPWVGAEIVGTLIPGDGVEVVSVSDGWALVEASIEAGEGYVSMDYLTNEAQRTGAYLVDACGRVRVRRSPGGERVRWLEDGEAVNVERWEMVKGEAWAFVGDGYVMGDCLTEAAR